MVGKLIKDARTAAKLTQEQLAWAVGGLTARDIGKAEREEIMLSNDELKRIAKATNVTQKSLLEAAKMDAAAMQGMAMMDAPLGMPGMGVPPMGMPVSMGDAPLAAALTPSRFNEPVMDLTAAERKLIERYRAADSKTKKAVNKLVKGDCPELVDIVVDGFQPFPPFGGPMGFGGRR